MLEVATMRLTVTQRGWVTIYDLRAAARNGQVVVVERRRQKK